MKKVVLYLGAAAFFAIAATNVGMAFKHEDRAKKIFAGTSEVDDGDGDRSNGSPVFTIDGESIYFTHLIGIGRSGYVHDDYDYLF